MIGNLKIHDKEEMDIDWIERIPWQYGDSNSV